MPPLDDPDPPKTKLADLERRLDAIDDDPLPELPAPPDPPPPDAPGPSPAQWRLVGLVVVAALFSLALRLIYGNGLEQTSLLFIGVPTFLGAALALTPRAGTFTGMLMKGVTMCLLLSAIVFHEGFICILMAAPLFYGVGLMAGLIVDAARRRDHRYALGLPLLVIASLEGLGEPLSFGRAETVEAVRVVPASPDQVAAALAEPPRFEAPLPTFLRMGFPRPLHASGGGLEPGDRWTIRFGGGEGHPGDMVFEVLSAGPGEARFRLVEDDSHIAHWLDWDAATVRWTARPDGTTEVRWRIDFTRRLDPAWYFAPAERYAMQLAAGYLIETLATPDA